MGGGSQTQRQNEFQIREPWAPSVASLSTILGGGLSAYNSGFGSQVYGGDRVANLSPATRASFDALRQNANVGLGSATAADDFLGRLIGQGGSTAATRDSVRGILGVDTVDTTGLQRVADRMSAPNNLTARAADQLAGGRFFQDGSGYARLNQGLAGPTQTQQSLLDVAQGKYLGDANPYRAQMAANATADAVNAAKTAMAASGRYGSGMFQGAVADAAARVGTEYAYKDYEAERARQAEAAQAIDNQLLARTGMRSSLIGARNDTRAANAAQLAQGAQLGLAGQQAALGAQQALASQQQANNAQSLAQWSAALGAGQSDRAAAMGGMSSIPTIQAAAMQPARNLAAIGSEVQNYQQRVLDAQQQRFNEMQMAPWRALGLLSGTALPIANVGGTATGNTTTQTEMDPGLLNSILGGALGIGGFAADLGKAAPGLMALFSDERVKTDVQRVGQLDDGQPVYRYRMAGDPRMQLGLIAQDVAEARPGAVMAGPDGILMVDYEEATGPAARKGAMKERRR